MSPNESKCEVPSGLCGFSYAAGLLVVAKEKLIKRNVSETFWTNFILYINDSDFETR